MNPDTDDPSGDSLPERPADPTAQLIADHIEHARRQDMLVDHRLRKLSAEIADSRAALADVAASRAEVGRVSTSPTADGLDARALAARLDDLDSRMDELERMLETLPQQMRPADGARLDRESWLDSSSSATVEPIDDPLSRLANSLAEADRVSPPATETRPDPNLVVDEGG